VQNRGVIRSSAESVAIISPLVAEVTKTILNENIKVAKGDTLVWLNCEKTSESIQHLKNLIADNEAYLNDISSMLAYKFTNIETEIYKAVHAQYRQKLSEYDLTKRVQQKSFNRAKALFYKKVIPELEFEEEQFQLDRCEEEKRNFVQMSRNEWQSQAVKYRLENKNYQNQIQSLNKDLTNYVILAPETGHIANFDGVKAGSYVSKGQTIAIISPDDNILAEELVSPQDIGFLKKDMSVIYQIDAYNYNQWGTVSGKITEIFNEIYVVNNQPYFKVRSSLDQTFLTLKNGYKGKLKKGLTATARFKVTERTLSQLLFDKADDWLNPKIVTE
jgi:HlyD family secretion protein